jgi:hypothetical protein
VKWVSARLADYFFSSLSPADVPMWATVMTGTTVSLSLSLSRIYMYINSKYILLRNGLSGSLPLLFYLLGLSAVLTAGRDAREVGERLKMAPGDCFIQTRPLLSK